MYEVVYVKNENNDEILQVTSLSTVTDVSKLEQNYSMILKKISHEFGNILTLINSSLQIIESSHPEVRSYKYWNSTMSDVHYMKDLVNELVCFNNSAKLNLNKININLIIENIIESFSLEKIYENINFHVDLPQNQVIVIADFVKIKQALINLIKNACEAIESKGDIYITIKQLDYNISIIIHDTGCGIEEKIIDDIFLPMFTSKKNGCGLGLAITKKIITSHSGSIKVTSKLGEGATFTIEIPIEQN